VVTTTEMWQQRLDALREAEEPVERRRDADQPMSAEKLVERLSRMRQRGPRPGSAD